MAAAAPDFFSDTSQFDVARKRASEQSAANLQANKDALARRFANSGNLDAGARLKLEQKATDAEEKNLQGANENIDAAQTQELRRRGEIKQGQEYQSGEAEKQRQFVTGERSAGQDFASQMAEAQRKYSTGERLSSQDFANLMAAKQREFATSERLGSQAYGSSERSAAESFAMDEAAKQRNLQRDQMSIAQKNFDKTFNEEVRINDANLKFAEWMKNQKDPLEQFGSGFGDIWHSFYDPFKSIGSSGSGGGSIGYNGGRFG